MEEIMSNGKLCAIVIRKDTKVNNLEFFTDREQTLQVGMHSKPKGFNIPAHTHKKILRTIESTQEYMYVIKGKICITVFDDNREKISEMFLEAGDSILLANGGHSIRILEDSEIIEVKQGPYTNTEDDKERFEVEE